MHAEQRAHLGRLLADARARGYLGPGPVDAHVDHALAWAAVVAAMPGPFLDLGSGAGLPGLVLALARPGDHGTLLDAGERRAAWLGYAVTELGLEGSVVALRGRAERMGHCPDLREQFPLVAARGFGTPAATAECASCFVTVGGRVTVSEPPGGDASRWSGEGLRQLGLTAERTVVQNGATFVILRKEESLIERFPRRDGLPQHRPLW